MTPRLRLYLELERLMLSLDEGDARSADSLRDAMDPIWYALTDEERHLLNERTVGRISSLEGLHVPVGQQFTYRIEQHRPKQLLPQAPILNWAA